MRTAMTMTVLLVPLLLQTGCGDALTAPAAFESLALRTAAAREDLPFRGDCTSTGVQVISFEPPVMRQVSTAVCTVSHLGRDAVVNQQVFNVATGMQLGSATLTTAGGDVIHATSTGTAAPTPAGILQFSGVMTMSGGTGRFHDAAGQADVTGSVELATGAGAFSYDGWISYNAAAAGR